MTKRMWCVALACVLAACASSGAKRAEDEKIQYSPPQGEEAARPEVPAGPTAMVRPETAPAADAEPAVEPAVAQPAGDAMVVRREDLKLLQQRGPAFLLAQVQVQPVKDTGGKFAGYAITAFTPEAKERLTPALREGDVITHFNGVRMKRPEDYMAAWKLLGTASEVRVDLVRDDQPSTVIWTVEP